MPTALEICNRALNFLGEPVLTNLSDTGVAADALTNRFVDVFHECQDEENWYFFTARAVLTENTSVTQYTPFDYVYDLPSDVYSVIGTDPRVDYVIMPVSGSMYLFCDYSADTTNNYPRVVYQVDVLSLDDNDDPVISSTYTSLIPAWFSRVVAAKLAMDSCIQITDKAELKQDMRSEYYLALKRARQFNEMYTPGASADPSTWGDIPVGT